MFPRTMCKMKLKDGTKKMLTLFSCGRFILREGNGVGGERAWSAGGDGEDGNQDTGRVIRQFGYQEDEEQQKADKSTGGRNSFVPLHHDRPCHTASDRCALAFTGQTAENAQRYERIHKSVRLIQIYNHQRLDFSFVRGISLTILQA